MRWFVLALIGVSLMLAASYASAEPRGHGWGHGHARPSWGWGSPRPYYRVDPGTAFWGGVVGGALGSLFRPKEPDVVVVQPQRDVSWCIQRYKSYDTYTRTYLGYDGLRHGCP